MIQKVFECLTQKSYCKQFVVFSMDYHRQTEPANHTLDVSSLRHLLLRKYIPLSSPHKPPRMGSPVCSSCLDPVFSWHSLHRPWSTYYCNRASSRGTLDGVAFRVCSSNRRYRAWISCKAELGDTSGTDLRKCLHLVHQRPYSINQNERGTDSNGCLEQKTGTGQSTVHPVPQSRVARLTASVCKCEPKNGENPCLHHESFLLWEQP